MYYIIIIMGQRVTKTAQNLKKPRKINNLLELHTNRSSYFLRWKNIIMAISRLIALSLVGATFALS